MKKIDLAAVDKMIREVAASEIMPRFHNLNDGDVEIKGDQSQVTVADKAAEAALTTRLQDYLPGSVIVGEETCDKMPHIMSRFHNDDPVWVIDPIDGTRNFIEGRPEFGVMVALVHRKKTIASWIHDPNTGDTLSAEQGSGVWLRGHKMQLAGRDPKIPQIGVVGSRIRGILSNPKTASVIAALPALAIGSAAAFDYARLFTGAVHFANNNAPRASFLLYRMSKPWDHVPGLFLQAEADGYSADLFGDPYDMANGKRGLLLAADEQAWGSLYQAVKPVLPALVSVDSH